MAYWPVITNVVLNEKARNRGVYTLQSQLH